MAIQYALDKKHEDNDYGYNFDDAYFHIVNVQIDVARSTANISVRGFASKTARNIERTIGIYKKIFKCSLEDLNIHKIKLKKNQTVSDAIKELAYNHIQKDHFKDGKKV